MVRCCQFLFFLLLNSLFCTPCPALHHSSPHDQALILLKFKESLIIGEISSFGCYKSSPKTKSWNKSTNCCSWEGITCDKVTGHVVEIDVSCSKLMGTIGSNNSLFQLSHLRRLNLAFNGIESSNIPKIFGNFTHLTHLNLSNNVFAGQVPSEILKLTELTSLDLSNNDFTFGPDIFELLLTNLTKLSQVFLTNLNILSSIPKNLSASLENVHLGNTSLRGEVPQTTFHLPKLQKFVLRFNPQLYGRLPSVRWNSSSTLEWLDLSGTSFWGEMPYSIGNLKVLKHLDLSGTSFLGGIPTSMGNLKAVEHLDLSFCGFNGSLPKGMLINMTQVQTINLSHNRLMGSLPSFPTKIQSLVFLYLDHNSFTGTIPSGFFSLLSLEYIDLSYNQLYGPIPMQLSSLVNLKSLDLSSNNFSGQVEMDIFSNMKQLYGISLSYNNLSVFTKTNSILPQSIDVLELASCNISNLDFLRSPPEYVWMDLSMNNIKEVPSWLWSKWNNILYLNISYNSITHKEGIYFQQIQVLDIRSNLFQGPFPQVPDFISYLFISNNQFFGVIPPSLLCSLSSIEMIDLSNNSFTGSIPQCVGNMSQELSVLDMHMNKFEGTIPNTFSTSKLVTLNMHGNQLRGNIPSSLAKCINLKVLDLGDNNLNDTFPSWLGVLPELRVLSLRSNNLHGKMNFSLTPTSFSKLQILDLSQNQLIGSVPPMFFKSFTGMMEINVTSEAKYIGDESYYKDSTIVVNKGIQIQLVRILTTWTTIDLSSNNFEGNISSSIGSLISLRQLNFSNNRFGGEIPTSFGNLSLLESLDLSSNQLFGTIPTQLTTLHALSKLNLSHNHLTGRIPGGTQFQTFTNDSYIGNNGLCGFPLTKICIGDKAYSPGPSEYPEQDASDFIDGLSWRSVIIGYGVGTVLGLCIGSLLVFTGKPVCLNRLVEDLGYTIVMKRDRKKKLSKCILREN